jgi:hypothetical protein
MTHKKTAGKKFQEPSVAVTVFNKDYTYHITDLVIDHFGDSYQTSDQIKNSWRKEIQASSEIADFLILHTKSFVRLLTIPCAKNPQFLKSLTINIADYLSVYFMRLDNASLCSLLKTSYKFQEPVTRKSVTKELYNVFYNNFEYVQNIMSDAQKKKDKRKKYFKKNPNKIASDDSPVLIKFYPNNGKLIKPNGTSTMYQLVCKTR